MTVTTPEGTMGLSAMYPPTYRAQRHLTSFLQWRFSLLPPGSYRYVEDGPDAKESEISIGLDTPIDPVILGQRPAVTILRGPAAFQGIGFNDLAGLNMNDDTQSRLDMIPTTLMVNVLSELPVEAERLAWFCADQIWTMREEITRTEKCIHMIGARPTLSAPTAAGALIDSTDHEWCVVVAAFPTYLVHSSTKQPLNKPILRDVEIRAEAE